MRSRVFVSLIVLFGLMSLNMAQDNLGVVYTVRDQPASIVLQQNVNYLYDPSDYVHGQYATYYMGTEEILQVSAPKVTSDDSYLFKIYEKDLGGWDKTMPALYLKPKTEETEITLVWDYMPAKSSVPTPDHNLNADIEIGDNVTCFDAVAITADTILLDCSEYYKANNFVGDSILIYYSLATKEVLGTSKSQTVFDDVKIDCDRKVAYYNFGDKAWVYRWLSIDCFNKYENASVEILDATDPTNIQSKYILNGANLGREFFNPVQVTMIMGDLFLSAPNDTYVVRVTNFESDYASFSITPFFLPNTPLATKAIYDIALDFAGVSLVVATQTVLYRVDWSEANYPYIVETVPYGSGNTGKIKGATDLTSVWASQNYYYVMADTDLKLLTFLRKAHNVSIPYGYFTYSKSGAGNVTLGISGVPQAIAVDADQDWFYLFTDVATGSFHNLQSAVTLDKNTQSFDISLVSSKLKDPVVAYTQNITVATEAEQTTGIFPTPHTDGAILTHQHDQTTWLFGVRTMTPTSGITPSGAIKAATELPRYETVNYDAPTGLTFNYILTDPYNWRNTFYWLTQDNTSFVNLQHCSIHPEWRTEGVSVSCVSLGNTTLTGSTVYQAAIGFDSEEHTVTFIALGITTDGTDSVTIRNPDFTELATKEGHCQLESTRSHSASLVYCLNEDDTITVWSTEFESTFETFTIDAADLGLTEFKPLSVVTSNRYPNILFIQQQQSIILASVGFAPTRYHIISTIALPEIPTTDEWSAVITENQIIVLQAKFISNYDLSNIRAPAVTNRKLNLIDSNIKIDLDTLSSSGSNLYVYSYDEKTAVFDAALPDFREGIDVPCGKLVASMSIMPQNELLFCMDEENNLTIMQYYNFVRLKTEFNEIASDAFEQFGCTTMDFTNAQSAYELCYEIYVPSYFQVEAIPPNQTKVNLTLDLSDKDKAHNYVGDITKLFKGPLNGNFSIETQQNNETTVFALQSPFNTLSAKLSFSAHHISSAINFNNIVYVLSNEGKPTVYAVDPTAENAVVGTYQLVLPTDDDEEFYHCSHLLVFDHPVTNTTFIVACRYNVTGEVSLIYQAKGATNSLFVFPDLDHINQARLNTSQDVLIVVGERTRESYLFIYQINGTITPSEAGLGASDYANLVPAVYNLNSVFGLEGMEFGGIVDFEFVNGPLSNDNPVLYFMFLQSNYGVRSAQFVTIPGPLIGYLEPYYAHRINGSDAFKNEKLPTLDWWSGIHVQDCSTFTTDSNCNILLVQAYGLSYLVQWNLQTGYTQILQAFYPYSNHWNLGPAQFLDGKVTFLTLSAMWPDTSFSVVSYPFDAANLNAAEPLINFGVFESVLPNLIWNYGPVNHSYIWSIDSKANLNRIIPQKNFTLKFIGSDTMAVRSNYVIITAWGGYNSSASANFSLILPVEPEPEDNGSNIALIIILSILGVGLIVGGFFVFKKWKASKEDYVSLPTEKKQQEV